jgi:hypothetical protein
MSQEQVDCSDLFDAAARDLKDLDTKIEERVKTLVKQVEETGVPKEKVVRTVVKELVARDVASPSWIYECLGIEKKQKKSLEESVTVAEQIVAELSSKIELPTKVNSSQKVLKKCIDQACIQKTNY